MQTEVTLGGRENVLGACWMVAAMAAFAIEDALIKVAAAAVPIGQILVIFGAGGALVFALIAVLRGEPLFVPDVLSPSMLVRVVCEITGRLFYVLAVAFIPLSTATVILQATPLVVVIGAVVVFGERVGWRRWVAILIGLTGVVLIIQPGTEEFSALSWLAVIGMLGFAGRDLASRAAPATVSTLLLGVYGFLSVVLAGVIYAVWEGAPFVVPMRDDAAALGGAVLAGVAAYGFLMKAMRTGEISAVTPFRYTRLIFGVTLGLLVFGEVLSVPVLLGSLLIVVSGLFILWRGKQASDVS